MWFSRSLAPSSKIVSGSWLTYSKWVNWGRNHDCWKGFCADLVLKLWAGPHQRVMDSASQMVPIGSVTEGNLWFFTTYMATYSIFSLSFFSLFPSCLIPSPAPILSSPSLYPFSWTSFLSMLFLCWYFLLFYPPLPSKFFCPQSLIFFFLSYLCLHVYL